MWTGSSNEVDDNRIGASVSDSDRSLTSKGTWVRRGGKLLLATATSATLVGLLVGSSADPSAAEAPEWAPGDWGDPAGPAGNRNPGGIRGQGDGGGTEKATSVEKAFSPNDNATDPINESGTLPSPKGERTSGDRFTSANYFELGQSAGSMSGKDGPYSLSNGSDLPISSPVGLGARNEEPVHSDGTPVGSADQWDFSAGRQESTSWLNGFGARNEDPVVGPGDGIPVGIFRSDAETSESELPAPTETDPKAIPTGYGVFPGKPGQASPTGDPEQPQPAAELAGWNFPVPTGYQANAEKTPEELFQDASALSRARDSVETMEDAQRAKAAKAEKQSLDMPVSSPAELREEAKFSSTHNLSRAVKAETTYREAAVAARPGDPDLADKFEAAAKKARVDAEKSRGRLNTIYKEEADLKKSPKAESGETSETTDADKTRQAERIEQERNAHRNIEAAHTATTKDIEDATNAHRNIEAAHTANEKKAERSKRDSESGGSGTTDANSESDQRSSGSKSEDVNNGRGSPHQED